MRNSTKKTNKISYTNSFINDVKIIDTHILLLEEQYIDINEQFKEFIYKYNIDHSNDDFKLETPRLFLETLLKESKPIIIDQPEDNLDNQSVYSKLVPCICRAKENVK